jgi:chemotaxis response regulator CheB
MAGADRAAGLGRVAERLLENQYAQENLREAAEGLRTAYRRASKRRVKPAEDKKLHEQVRSAAASISEAASAVRDGRRKPKRRVGKRLLIVVGVAAGGAAAVAVGMNDELRAKLFGSDDGTSSEAGQR